MDYLLLGKRIRAERKKLNLTQENLAERAGISTNFMGQIERGDRKLSVETLVSIASSLGSSVDGLLLPREDDAITQDMLTIMTVLSQEKKILVRDLAKRLKEI